MLAAPDRRCLLTAELLSYAVAGVVLSLLVTVATIVLGTLILDARGEATLGNDGLAAVLWRNLAVAAVLGPLGVCVGALVRNQIGTVVGLIAMAEVIEPAVSQVAPDVGRFRPMTGAARRNPRRPRRASWRPASPSRC